MEPVSPELDRIGKILVDCFFKVHTELGPGLLESVFEACLYHEILKRRLKVLRQVVLPITYDGVQIEDGLRIDLLVENAIIIEIKAVEKILPVHEAQLLTYLKLSGLRLGYLVNFNVALIKDGIKRMVR